MARHWSDQTLEICGAEVEASIEYDFTPGRPAYTPRGEYAPIDPPDPAEVSIVKAELLIDDKRIPAPGWLTAILQEDDHLYDRLVDAAESYEPEYA